MGFRFRGFYKSKSVCGPPSVAEASNIETHRTYLATWVYAKKFFNQDALVPP